uniref:Uncharacterized protein n=1 Tax=Eptatretus burgeri TaxID=7764 RepID=A0A8C4RDP1_EPTBU
MNSHFLGDPAKKGAVITIQSGYRGYRARKDLKTKHQSATTIQANYRGYQTRNHPKVTNQVHSSPSISQNSQGYSSRTSSRSPCESPKCDPDSAVEDHRRVQMGKVIQPRVGHDGGTTSHDMSLNITKKTTLPDVDVVSCYGLDGSGMNSHFLGDPAKEGAVVTIQSGYRGYRARKDLKTKQQSATTIQANYHGYGSKKDLDSKMKTSTFHEQDERDDMFKEEAKVYYRKVLLRSKLGDSHEQTSRAPVNGSQNEALKDTLAAGNVSPNVSVVTSMNIYNLKICPELGN